MITSNEIFKVPGKHIAFAANLYKELTKHLMPGYVIAICGESGSGKSVTTIALYNYLCSLGKKVITLHMDNYFHLAPIKNHNQRILNINTVGKNEVDLKMLQEHVNCFKSKVKSCLLPILNYSQSEFSLRETDLTEYDFVLLEGTYVYELDNLDLKVFLDIDFIKTKANRIARGRDTINEFSERVLKIEHNLVKSYAQKADIIIDDNFQITSKK